jgi:hypothetical protein
MVIASCQLASVDKRFYFAYTTRTSKVKSVGDLTADGFINSIRLRYVNGIELSSSSLVSANINSFVLHRFQIWHSENAYLDTRI